MVTLTIDKEYHNLKPHFPFIFNQGINFIVGTNGSGKSALIDRLLLAVHKHNKKLIPHYAWKVYSLNDSEHVTCSGLENISQVLISSTQLRHTQFIDMDAVFEMGPEHLHASEGESVQYTLCKIAKAMQDPNALYILDEADCHLDLKTKQVYFNILLNKIKGIAIVITHDLFFLTTQSFPPKVFDMDSYTYRDVKEYGASILSGKK